MATPGNNFNVSGDLLVSGDVINPGLNQVLIDTGAIVLNADNFTYFDFTVTLQSTVATIFEVGIFNNNDSPYKTLMISTVSNDSKTFSLFNVPVADNQKLKIRSNLGIVGTVNVSMNLQAIGRN